MNRNTSSCLLTLLGLVGGAIAGPVLVLALMQSASRYGRPVGFEGIFYLMVSPMVGAVAGAAICNASSKKNDPK